MQQFIKLLDSKHLASIENVFAELSRVYCSPPNVKRFSSRVVRVHLFNWRAHSMAYSKFSNRIDPTSASYQARLDPRFGSFLPHLAGHIRPAWAC